MSDVDPIKMLDLPKVLTITQIDAARTFGVSDRTVRRWESRGHIRGTRVDGVKLYPLADLKRLVGVK